MVLDMSFNSIFQMYHYLERTYQHVQTHKERLFDLHITEAMAKVFPKVNQKSPHIKGHLQKPRVLSPLRSIQSMERSGFSTLDLQR